MAQKQTTRKSESAKKKRKSLSNTLKGDSTVDYQMGALDQDSDARSKKNVQGKLNAQNKQKTPQQMEKQLPAKKSTEKKSKKNKAKEKQKATSETVSEKSNATAASATKASNKKETASTVTEEVSTKKAQRRIRDMTQERTNRHRQMAVLAISDKQCLTKASMFKCIRNATKAVAARDGLQNYRFRAEAMAMIHQSAEDYLSNIFYIADMLSAMRGVETINVNDFRMATAIARGEVGINMSKKRKREILEGKPLEFFTPEEALEGVTMKELNELNVPEKFKMEAYLPSGASKEVKEEESSEQPKKKRKVSQSTEEDTQETDDADSIEEGYSSGDV